MSSSQHSISCVLKSLTPDREAKACAIAILNNPQNSPPIGVMSAIATIAPGSQIEPEYLAVLVAKYWGTSGVHLTVGFMEEVSSDLADRILSHMNAWSEFCNVKFSLVDISSIPQVRITLGNNGQYQGYWSYLGTDILSIPANQPTMCLQDFSMNTPESEYERVVPHEAGHTLGFPHEHMRREIVALLDSRKTKAYFKKTYGWSAQMVQQQVLTPLDQRSIMGTTIPDVTSIMCYQLPGNCTKSGKPIPGGLKIDKVDQLFASKIYPLSVSNEPPPPTMPFVSDEP